MMKNNPLSSSALVLLPLLALSLLVAACREVEAPAPTAVIEPTAQVVEEVAEIQPTWTPLPVLLPVTEAAEEGDDAPATATALPSPTPRPTRTPIPSPTEEPTATAEPSPEPSATPESTATSRPSPTVQTAATKPPAPAAPPTIPPDPTFGLNVLPNPSFEEGHYNQNGIPELQLPNGWRLAFETGATGFGSEPWDIFVRPETRVLSRAFLPEHEHALYIFDGGHTVKIFKDAGAINVRLMTDVELQPGTYVLEANLFADVFEGFQDGRKIAPADLDAAEMALFAGNGGTGWVRHPYLQPYNASYTFTLTQPQKVTVGIGLRGRYAIANNGWFVDNFSLRRLE